MILRQAERQQAKIKMGLQGPSGSGKTYSSLLLASGLTQDWTKIAIIDTENHSADLYAHLGRYNVLTLMPPFSPERYIEALEICENSGVEVIIIDSISHEWEGQGGILEIHSNMIGNSFTNWSKITPRHNAFIQRILQSPAHVIATIRSKQAYVLSEKNGKFAPEKVGLKGVTKEGLDYELTLVFDLDVKHNTTSTKDRTGLFMDKPQFVITPEIGKRIKNWCQSGKGFEEVAIAIQKANSLEELQFIFKSYPEYRQQLTFLCTKRKQQLLNPIVETTEI